ncbi:Y-family DNA polymerase [Pseudoprimorskyibacter insulae]|uniref:DNA-directed DNA polymerase n=1 Tax=Pseudoprimorskyibacter insulae TaxID=1695997 RepID=A0A2R8AUD9_9RHOB|nr:DNA polymerase Y family protein [Pseudoprimorskyibacter insulae]SPF79600.1 DNA polymerase IV [Pseudoprimorskyibacter insulae]
MPNRRILSIWFPRLGAERLIRRNPLLADQPLAVVRDTGQMQVVCSVSDVASAAGVHVGQPLRDAHAMCANLVTRLHNPHAEAAFLGVLHRWAGKFSPWIAQQTPDSLVIDLTGCTHLFGGEEALLAEVDGDCAGLGLTVRMGVADTLGAAWALARYSGQSGASHRNGDAIDQEARATRARAGKRRHWERGGAAPVAFARPGPHGRIAPPGQTHAALAPLPVAALRLPAKTSEDLARLGLRRIGDLTGQPRAALARRFGQDLVLRLGQALGSTPEPVSPAAPPDHFAARLNLPEPIGLSDDLLAALDKMLPRLCDRLKQRGRGARTLRLEAYRCDDTMQWLTVSLARPADTPERIHPLLAMKLDEVEAGFGIDMLRLEVIRHEPLHARTMTGHAGALGDARKRQTQAHVLDDLIGRLGARIGLEAITRRHPGQSHLPEKSAQVLAAAWSEPAPDWPERTRPRPLLLWRSEPVQAHDTPAPPSQFRWRGRSFDALACEGPERIAPEWWLDDPDWRTGQRDYWRVDTDQGDRLWLYYAHGAALSSGWFCQGSFA